MVASKIGAQPARLARRPNLIVFLPDQQRPDTLSCYGARQAFAPNLDNLAAQSCVFRQAYVTQPVCTPSRSCLMSGTWPHTNGCTHNGLQLPQNFHCLPEMIADPDYRFGYMGKWHLGDEVLAQHGFNEWISIHAAQEINPATGRPEMVLSDYENFLMSNHVEPDKSKHGRLFSAKFETTLPLALSKPKFLAAKACDFLERHRREPFVLFVGFFEPHPPYNGPLNDAHSASELELDATADHTFGSDMPLRYRLRQEWAKERFGATSRQKKLRIKANYLGLVTEMDQGIGVILSKLEQLGLAEDTIVMHTSDHGDMMSAHRLFGKEVMFEEATHVPWLVRLPAQQRSVSISQAVSHVDFAPTIVDLLGKPPHQQCAGKSLAPLLLGARVAAENVFVEWHPSRKQKLLKHTRLATKEQVKQAMNEISRMLISPDGWKLCLRDSDSNELYNLKSDPGETQNLYSSLARKEVVQRLTGDIHRWQESVGDKVKV
jgi:arylsulfatase A-like enzyme